MKKVSMFLLVTLMMISSVQPVSAMEAAAADEVPAGTMSPRPDSASDQGPIVAPLASPRSKSSDEVLLPDQADLLDAAAVQSSNSSRRGSIADVSARRASVPLVRTNSQAGLDAAAELARNSSRRGSVVAQNIQEEQGESIAGFFKSAHLSPHVREFYEKNQALVAKHAELQDSFLAAHNLAVRQEADLQEQKKLTEASEERCAQLVRQYAVLQDKCTQLEALRAERQSSVGSDFEIEVTDQDGTSECKKMKRRGASSSRHKNGDAGAENGQEAVERKEGPSNDASKSSDASESSETGNKATSWWAAARAAWATPIVR